MDRTVISAAVPAIQKSWDSPWTELSAPFNGSTLFSKSLEAGPLSVWNGRSGRVSDCKPLAFTLDVAVRTRICAGYNSRRLAAGWSSDPGFLVVAGLSVVTAVLYLRINAARQLPVS